MNILLLGSGGREHALSWKMKQSPLCDELFVAPGNGGTSMLGTNLSISYNDFAAVKKVVLEKNIGMLVVGPEEPLVEGIVDFFKQDLELKNVLVIGPSQAGAELEGSKDFAKKFMVRHGIPTAKYETFTVNDLQKGLSYIDQCQTPIVLKADGLAAGKGVLIIDNHDEAKTEFEAMLSGKFGAASEKIVIEEFLTGLEFSVFVLTDGKNYKVFPVAKDYKRIGEGDQGLNTGGMGAISPVPFVDQDMMNKVEKEVIIPTVKGLGKDDLDYVGFIFIGLINTNGQPKVIEYNCRLGDPETEVILPRLKNDLVQIFKATAEGKLDRESIDFDEKTAATIMLVSSGYPETYKKGKLMHGLEQCSDSLLFHAGTIVENGILKTNGGRVLAITSFGNDFKSAVSLSLTNAAKINFEGKYYRTDIGFDLS